MNRTHVTLGLLLCMTTLATLSFAQTSVTTQHNDIGRTGWNKCEYILTQANVRPGSFGKLFTRDVDDYIYAQPLAVANVALPDAGTHNLVFVATMNNSVYAFDGDSINLSNPYWKVNLTPADSRPAKNTDIPGCNSNDIQGNIGIISTPVIDTATSTLYLVAKSYDSVHSMFSQYLHALDITTGAEKCGGPKLISASVPGTGAGSVNGIVPFDPLYENQRAGLLLLNDVVYIAWGSHCDIQPYHGWLMGYDKNTLEQKSVFNASPNGEGGGIWMCGGGPSADANGNIYVASGDGTPGSGIDTADNTLAELKLVPSASGLIVSDYFRPYDAGKLDSANKDLSSQVMIIPSANVSMAMGKDGKIYEVNTANMSRFNADSNHIIQSYKMQTSQKLHTNSAYYKGTQNEYAFVWAGGAGLTAFPFDVVNGKIDFTKAKSSLVLGPSGVFGATLSISSNASVDSTAIIWASHIPSGTYSVTGTRPGMLRAFAANDINTELWNSGVAPGDSVTTNAKFVCPTVANGKVYMATFSKKLLVYGLLGSSVQTCNPVNVAKNKPATASTTNGTNIAKNATDGKANTSWLSNGGRAQTITVDLGASYSLCKVILKWANTNVQDFSLQASVDSTTWTNVISIHSNLAPTNTLLVSGTGRYIRMVGNLTKNNANYALKEFEIYGNKVILNNTLYVTTSNALKANNQSGH